MNPQPKIKYKKKKKTAIPKHIVNAVFKRDGYRCKYCKQRQPVEQNSLQCHHIINKSQGGKDTLENLVTLCWYHHTLVTRKQIPNNFVNEREYDINKSKT